MKKLSELDAEAVELEFVTQQYTSFARYGDSGSNVRMLQFYLDFISTFNDFIPKTSIDGIFGSATENAVRAYQRAYGLPITGDVNQETWDSMYELYFSILNTLPKDYFGEDITPYPGDILYRGSSGDSVRILQTYLSRISGVYTEIPKVSVTGYFGDETEEAVLAYQNLFGLEARGVVGPTTWSNIAQRYVDLVNGSMKSEGQYPGYVIEEEVE